MEIKTEYKSVLNMLDLKIIDASFHMSEDGVQEAELGVSVDRKLEKDETDNYPLIERNAIAIMFPYLRSYISSLTTQPGMQPIVLPPINIMELLSGQK